jgi:hypothetical protein
VVAELHRGACLPADLDRLAHRLQEPGRLVTDVAGVEAAEGGRDPRQLGQLGGRGEAPRRVDEPARQPERALAHGGGHQLAHRVQLGRCGRAVVQAHDRDAHAAVADQQGEVAGQRQPGQPAGVAVQVAPVPVEPGVQEGAGVAQQAGGRRGGRERREAAVAEHLGGHALPGHGRRAREARQREVRVGVQVDEPGSHHGAVGGDDPPRRRPPEPADLADHAPLHRHVAGHRLRAAPVDDPRTTDQQIMHASLRSSRTRPLAPARSPPPACTPRPSCRTIALL